MGDNLMVSPFVTREEYKALIDHYNNTMDNVGNSTKIHNELTAHLIIKYNQIKRGMVFISSVSLIQLILIGILFFR